MVDGEDGRATQQREKNLRTRVKERGEEARAGDAEDREG